MARQTGSVTVKAAYIMAAGAVIAAVITGIILLIASRPTIQTTVSGQKNTTVTQTGGTMHITSTEIPEKLAEELKAINYRIDDFLIAISQDTIDHDSSKMRIIAIDFEKKIEKLQSITDSEEDRLTLVAEIQDIKKDFEILMRQTKENLNTAQAYLRSIKSKHRVLKLKERLAALKEHTGPLEEHLAALEDRERHLMKRKAALEIQYKLAKQFGETFKKMQDNGVKRFALDI